MTRSIWKAFWILSGLCSSLVVNSINSLNERNMSYTISRILKAYDVRLRPNFGADPLYVGIAIKIAEINEFSEVNMDYTVTIFLNQYWKDERLAFSTREESLTFTGEFAKRIWVPDIFFPSDKDSFIHDVTEQNQMVELSSDGSILYGMRFTTRESCQMDLRNFPLDSQNCTVEIESYGYTVRDVVMYWKDDPISGLDNVKLPQLQIAGYETKDRIEKLATGVYQRLSLSFKFERRFGYFFTQMYLPSILIVVLSWVSFWISNEATAARVGLGITTVLTMTTISNSLRSSLPKISYIKAIDVYLVVCFLFVFAALVEYAAVNYILWEGKEAKKKKCSKIRKSSKRRIPRMSTLKRIVLRKGKDSNDEGREEKVFPWRLPTCSIEEYPPPPTLSKLPSIVPPSRMVRSSSFSGPISMERRCHVKLPRSYLTKTPFTSSCRRVKVRFINSFRKRTNVVILQDVSSVDCYSRFIFPSTFILFNIIYWNVYIHKG